MEGQMTVQERIFLYQAALEKLSIMENGTALEIGTWKGGGSTLQISTAIMNVDLSGHYRGNILHTCEVDPILYSEAVAAYETTPQSKYVVFHNKPSDIVIDELIWKGNIPQFVFFDGPEDPEINMNDFLKLDEHLKVGTRFCMHDWDLDVRFDGLVSTKAKLLRPYLEKSNKWHQIGSLTKPISVGIVLMEKVST